MRPAASAERAEPALGRAAASVSDATESATSLRIIHNPTAGWRRLRFLAAVESALAATGVAARVSPTGARGDAERFARAAAAAGEPAVAVAGGDGTINEAINGLAGGQTALAVIPLGTANVFAAELALPQSPDAIAALAARATRRTIHLGTIALAGGTVRRFSIMAGVGFDAHVVANLNLPLKRATGKFAYVWQTLVEWARLKPRRYRVTADGAAYDCASAIVAKGHFYAGRYVAAPEASPDRDSFELVLFERGGRWAVLRYAMALGIGRLPKAKGVRIISAREILIESSGQEPVHADGDIVGAIPARFSISPEKLSVLAPARSA